MKNTKYDNWAFHTPNSKSLLSKLTLACSEEDLHQVLWRFTDERPQSEHTQLYKKQKVKSTQGRPYQSLVSCLCSEMMISCRFDRKGCFETLIIFSTNQSCDKAPITVQSHVIQTHTQSFSHPSGRDLSSTTQWKKQTSLWIPASVTKPVPLPSIMEKVAKKNPKSGRFD